MGLELLLLVVAGFIGGMLNAVAGGGTFITFPALVFTGVPPIAANATTTVAALPGYLASALGFRRDLARIDRATVVRLTLWTMVGGAVGSALLLVSSNQAFALLVPFLLMIATLVFVFGPQVRTMASRFRGGVAAFGAGSMMPVAIYGGYFNGGLGIILLALFALWGMTDLHAMNGLKTWLSFALSVISTAIFAVGGQIVWLECLVMSVGTILGGFLGAPVARRLPVPALRALIAVVGFGMTAVFFMRLANGG
ncbi:sulfite exporter TauE/SafE family protein [uncultured Paracoccus sp.]|uniref:sulfite exporter TauE/SafE family protein n=1 Tax=uncultured Paracoccus sp. TaxID=189685 RepID=UPI00261FC8C9|nr:sulfite exporter TauE/SafE family protein [uncultured Paracoccus sp.]